MLFSLAVHGEAALHRISLDEMSAPKPAGGIGVWNGAACFPQATSVTLTNSARFAQMDDVKAALPVLTFADSADDQSFVGGTFTNGQRSVSAGITKTSASTLLLDSPVAVTGTVRVTAGTLKVACRAVSSNAGLREWHLASTAWFSFGPL